MKSRQTFTPADRIRRRSEFQRVYERGRKIPSRSFTLFVLENELQRPRLGITITRRFGGAVERNRTKRLLREWFRKARKDLPAMDLVINVRTGVQRATLFALARELDEKIRRAPSRREPL